MLGTRHHRCVELPGILVSGLGYESFPGIEQVLFVEQDSTWGGAADGSQARPYTTIGAAMTAAAALTPAADNRILILVYPGVYDEEVTGDSYVDIVGVDRDTVIVSRATAGDYALVDADGHTTYRNMTFESGATNTGPLHLTAANRIEFVDCTILCSNPGNMADSCYVLIDGASDVRFYDCKFVATTAWSQIWSNIHLEGASVTLMHNCQFEGSYIISDDTADLTIIGGNYLSSASGNNCIEWGSTGDLTVMHARLSSTEFSVIDLNAQPTYCVIMNNVMECAVQYYCVDASAARTGLVVENNTMFVGGLHQRISHLNPNKIVGSSGMRDWYGTVSEAATACTYDDCVIEMHVDETTTTTITMPTSQVITLDGRGVHTLSYANNNIIDQGTGSLTIRRLTVVGNIRMNTAGTAFLCLEECDVTGRVDVVSGDGSSELRIERSRVSAVGTTLNYALRIADADPDMIIEQSFLKGAVDNVAVYYDTVTNDNLMIKNSTIVHGNGGATAAFGRSGAQTPDYRSHHYGYTVAAPAWLTNLIAGAQQFGTIDVNVDWPG